MIYREFFIIASNIIYYFKDKIIVLYIYCFKFNEIKYIIKEGAIIILLFKHKYRRNGMIFYEKKHKETGCPSGKGRPGFLYTKSPDFRRNPVLSFIAESGNSRPAWRSSRGRGCRHCKKQTVLPVSPRRRWPRPAA